MQGSSISWLAWEPGRAGGGRGGWQEGERGEGEEEGEGDRRVLAQKGG